MATFMKHTSHAAAATAVAATAAASGCAETLLPSLRGRSEVAVFREPALHNQKPNDNKLRSNAPAQSPLPTLAEVIEQDKLSHFASRESSPFDCSVFRPPVAPTAKL